MSFPRTVLLAAAAGLALSGCSDRLTGANYGFAYLPMMPKSTG